MLYFRFWVLVWLLFFILASGCEVYSSLTVFMLLFISRREQIFNKFALKMFKPTSSSIS